VLDGFYPLRHGCSVAVTAPTRAAGAQLAMDVIVGISTQLHVTGSAQLAWWRGPSLHAPDLGSQGVAIVYCTVGAPVPTTLGTIRHLQASGAAEHTAVVAAPAGSPAGAQYLAPHTAWALARSLARGGRHVLVVLDSVPAFVSGGRQVHRAEGMAGTGSGSAMLHDLGRLLDACAYMPLPSSADTYVTASTYASTRPIASSVTGLLIGEREAEQGGRAWAAQDPSIRVAVGYVAGLADHHIDITPGTLAAAPLVPVDFDPLVRRFGEAPVARATMEACCPHAHTPSFLPLAHHCT